MTPLVSAFWLVDAALSIVACSLGQSAAKLPTRRTFNDYNRLGVASAFFRRLPLRDSLDPPERVLLGY
jgi:hypothetical protein